jgi:hypothetical protein
MIRVNINRQSQSKNGVQEPEYIQKLLATALYEFSEDYQVPTQDSWVYVREDPARLQMIINRYTGATSQAYDMRPLPNWGVYFDDEDPVIVEYKLTYGT